MKQNSKNKGKTCDFKKYVERLATNDGWRQAYSILNKAGEAAIDDILDGLSHSNWRIRRWCAAFMDHYADDRCVEALIRALDDPIADVRRYAVHSIGCQPCKTAPLKVDVVGLLIARIMNDSSLRVRRVAAHMLGCQAPDKRAVKALKAILQQETDNKLLSNAKWALEQHKNESRKNEEARKVTKKTNCSFVDS